MSKELPNIFSKPSNFKEVLQSLIDLMMPDEILLNTSQIKYIYIQGIKWTCPSEYLVKTFSTQPKTSN